MLKNDQLKSKEEKEANLSCFTKVAEKKYIDELDRKEKKKEEKEEDIFIISFKIEKRKEK